MQYRPEQPINEPVALEIRALFPIPKSWSKRKRQEVLAGLPHASKPDADNVLKHLCDILTTLRFWNDDAQVFQKKIGKFYSEEPGWMIWITPWSELGWMGN
jgi:Holliday junction resolvase RusA-like endonuclease